MKYCEECGAELADNAEFCDECGAKQSTIQTANPISQKEGIQKENPSVQKSRKSLLIIIIVVVVLAVLAAVVILVMSNQEISKNGQLATEKDVVKNGAVAQATEEAIQESDIEETSVPTDPPTTETIEPPTTEPIEQPTTEPTSEATHVEEVDYSYLQPSWYSGTSGGWEISIISISGNQISFEVSYSDEENYVTYYTNLITGTIENGTIRFYGEVFAPGISLDGEIDFPSTATGTAYFNYRIENGTQVEIDTVQLWNSSQYAG